MPFTPKYIPIYMHSSTFGKEITLFLDHFYINVMKYLYLLKVLHLIEDPFGKLG